MAFLQSSHTRTRLNTFFVSICDLGMPKKNWLEMPHLKIDLHDCTTKEKDF
jgi:hypothetical protein